MNRGVKMRKGLEFICFFTILLMAVCVLPASAQWGLPTSPILLPPIPYWEIPLYYLKPDLVPGMVPGYEETNEDICNPKYVQFNSDDTITFFVKNQGILNSTECFAKIYLMSYDGYYIHYRFIPALAPGQKVELWPPITPTQDWLDGAPLFSSIMIRVDCFNTVDEFNESNNEESEYICPE
jgi:hypothetical protein